jgi:hypothetical protein
MDNDKSRHKYNTRMVLYRGCCLDGEFSLSDADIWNDLADPSRSGDFYMSDGIELRIGGNRQKQSG